MFFFHCCFFVLDFSTHIHGVFEKPPKTCLLYFVFSLLIYFLISLLMLLYVVCIGFLCLLSLFFLFLFLN